MNPDKKFRLAERLLVLNSESPERRQSLYKRSAIPEKVFSLERPVKIEDLTVPPFTLDRGEAISIHLSNSDFFHRFIPLLEEDGTVAKGKWISLDLKKSGFFQSYERKDRWISRKFNMPLGFGKRAIHKNQIDNRKTRPQDLLALQLLALNLACETTFDTIIPDFSGLDPISSQQLNSAIKTRLDKHAWIFSNHVNKTIKRCITPFQSY